MFNIIINKIRDILRVEAIIGKDSINYCIAFLVIRSLDESLCQKLNIDNNYTFNNLINTNSINKLYEKIYNPNSSDFLVYHLVFKLNMNFLREFKIKSPENLYNILISLKDLNIKELNEKYDLIGTIYELHLKTGTNNGRDLGQYFTNRLVIEYMINLVDPKLNETICDPTMGTGGFLTMAVKHLNKKYKINWSQYKNFIYGYDIDEEITSLSNLNLLIETGEKFDNLKCKNVLTTNINNKFDIILANEPMGINIDYDLCSDTIKDFNIKSSTESLFMQLFMQLLKPNGRACIIVPEGFLSSVKNKTKEYLVNNFLIKKVIHLNGSFFMNTKIDTYILYFINSGRKTENIDFCVLDNNLQEKKILNIEYENIKDNNYNLVYRFYITVNYNIKDYPLYKLKDICVFLPKSNRKASYGKDVGFYPFFCSGKKIKYCDSYDYDCESIIIGNGGTANINYGTKFSCSDHTHVLTSKYQDVLIKFLYYYLKNHIDILQRGFCGTGIKNISKEYIENIEVPIPMVEIQEKIIKRMDNLYYKIDKLKDKLIKTENEI